MIIILMFSTLYSLLAVIIIFMFSTWYSSLAVIIIFMFSTWYSSLAVIIICMFSTWYSLLAVIIICMFSTWYSLLAVIIILYVFYMIQFTRGDLEQSFQRLMKEHLELEKSYALLQAKVGQSHIDPQRDNKVTYH